MRIREAKEKFQSYYRGTTPPSYENEWVDRDEKSNFKRVAFYEWASSTAPHVQGIWGGRQDDFWIGGREHLTLFDAPLVYKLNIVSKFGYVVDLDPDTPGLTPCQDPELYLDRFIATEEIWPNNIEFLGVVGNKYEYSILTQHDWIDGIEATYSEIREHMLGKGFYEITKSFGHENSLSFYNDDFGIFDLRPANVVRLLDGSIIPIDCFVERLDAQKIEYLEQLRKP